jgi:hypothetical protein
LAKVLHCCKEPQAESSALTPLGPKLQADNDDNFNGRQHDESLSSSMYQATTMATPKY